jgi:hypothetical protein
VQVIGELAGQEDGAEAFWARVKTNLQAGRVRMVFVADRIPPELQRIVEFLNEQMDPAEVLAVELRQFLGGGVKTLAPRVLGQTAAAERQKGTGSPASVPFAERIQHAAPEVHEAARLLDQWATTTNVVAKDMRGARTYFAGRVNLLTLNPTLGHVQFNLEALRQTGRTADADAIQSLLSRVAGKPMTPLYPNLPCAALVGNWEQVNSQILPAYLDARIQAAGGEPLGADESDSYLAGDDCGRITAESEVSHRLVLIVTGPSGEVGRRASMSRLLKERPEYGVILCRRSKRGPARVCRRRRQPALEVADVRSPQQIGHLLRRTWQPWCGLSTRRLAHRYIDNLLGAR